MAKGLEKGDADWKVMFSRIDRDLAKEARDKVTARASDAAKFAHTKGKGKGKADGAAQKGGSGHGSAASSAA
eukprot:4134009-Pyramimonas_sp.AAC.1